jgi:hypothetical protein
MQSSRKTGIALWAAIGFVLLGTYVVAPELYKFGWEWYSPGYWIGTFIGAGIAGAAIGGLIGFFITRKSN